MHGASVPPCSCMVPDWLPDWLPTALRLALCLQAPPSCPTPACRCRWCRWCPFQHRPWIWAWRRRTLGWACTPACQCLTICRRRLTSHPGVEVRSKQASTDTARILLPARPPLAFIANSEPPARSILPCALQARLCSRRFTCCPLCITPGRQSCPTTWRMPQGRCRQCGVTTAPRHFGSHSSSGPRGAEGRLSRRRAGPPQWQPRRRDGGRAAVHPPR